MSQILVGEILACLMFVGVIGVLLIGFPVAFSLAGTALIFGVVGWLLGVYDPSNYGSVIGRYIGLMTSETLVAVPLFVFMGVMLERSGIAERLLLTHIPVWTDINTVVNEAKEGYSGGIAVAVSGVTYGVFSGSQLGTPKSLPTAPVSIVRSSPNREWQGTKSRSKRK